MLIFLVEMFSSNYKHFEKELERNSNYFLSLLDSGSVIKITEIRKNVSFSINLDLGGAAWLSNTIISVLRQNPMEEFKHFYRNHNYILAIKSSRNSAGRFMKIWKLVNGNLSYLFILEEFKGQGWSKFSGCLHSFFDTKNWQKEIRLKIKEEKPLQDGPVEDAIAMNGEAWRKQKTKDGVQNQEEIPSKLQERLGKEQLKRNWRNAIVVYRNSIQITWGEIRKRVEGELRREVVVLSLAGDRAIIWCQHEDEISNLLSNPLQFCRWKISGQNRAMELVRPLG